MKLVIQIACFNEEECLAETLQALPRQIPGVETIEALIVDDGSTDRTCAVARAHGVRHIVRFTKRQGLSRAFLAGMHASLQRGADIIVHTDADNQYCADDIAALIQPIREGRADMVIGVRPIRHIDHFSPLKKAMQRLGSALVRFVSKTDVGDAASGFRAFSRETALKLNVFNNFTYTHETIIQAGLKNLAVATVPVRVNPPRRPSRLFRSVPVYIARSLIAIARMVVVYRPFRFFLSIGLAFLLVGLLFALRYLYFMIGGQGGGHVQSVVLGGVLIGIGFQTVLVAFLADLLGVNRRLLEEIQYRQRRSDLQAGRRESDAASAPKPE